MLFLAYFELNENMPESERIQVAQKLTSSGLFPPKGVNIIRWDGTPDGWGVLTLEADNVADIVRTIDIWRAAGAGFFKLTKTAPAMPIQELLPVAGGIQSALGSI